MTADIHELALLPTGTRCADCHCQILVVMHDGPIVEEEDDSGYAWVSCVNPRCDNNTPELVMSDDEADLPEFVEVWCEEDDV